jgi:NADPH:quinone reductase-like Zn-dependent oxidoreductase
MQVAGIEEYGGPVETIDVPDPRPLADDEVLIEVQAAGVANWDEFVRTGDWDVGRTPPMALGVAAAGVIAAAGEKVEEWKPGDEVLTHPLPLRDQGTWAPSLIAPAELLARKPDAVAWDVAAVFPVSALTATQVIDETLGVNADDLVLVHGGSGVTGSVLVSLAAVRGAEVVATASPANHERLLRLGASKVLDYHDPGWPDEARAQGNGEGVSAAANATSGGEADAIRAVRDGGRLVTITSDPPSEERGITVTSLIVRADGPQLGEMVDLLAAGKLDIAVTSTFGLAEAAAALAAAQAGHGGAVVLRPSPE